EARGEKAEVSLLLVHAQDHLMNAITFKDLAKEIVDLYRSK
ncbi:PTS lactose/cellobiose transporter subunit IIA, partial [Listeria monocytogenes]